MITSRDVTIVVPTIAGREELLRRALASVDAQQFTPGGVVVLLDKNRLGAHVARNEALKEVKTDWVAWLDDDDELLPNHLKVLVRGANKSRADMVFTYPEFVGGVDPLAVADPIANLFIASPVNVPWDASAEWSLRTHGNFIPVTYMVKTEAVRAVGGFPAPYSFDAPASRDCEDYGLLLKLLDAGYRFHHVCGVRTWRYHYHESNTGGRGADRMHELGGKT